MPIKLDSVYDPHKVEEKIYKFWEDKGYFHGQAKSTAKPFSLVIPPPNVTGILHMGHVLDNTPQDILVRFKRMQGFATTWVPGTDHAGIATQNAVEKSLAREGIKRQDLSREDFLQRVWKWKEQYGDIIIQQLKRLGCSCDWDRTRFTMDEAYSQAVLEVFIRLYKKGLIYRGNYIINWCPRCQTALSDEEAEHRDVEGALYWIRYQLKESKNKEAKERRNQSLSSIVVATTRPETMLGDTAISVHPDDRRYKDLIGKLAILPILNREIPIIADPFTNPEFGSGAVKVTPAHDPNDFLMGQRHNLPLVIAIGPDGKMTEEAGPYKGQDRFECRKNILKDLNKQGLYEKQDKHLHAVGHCYRCETIIEPYLSKQWFVKMKPLAEPAIKAAQDDRVKFFPERWRRVYLDWLGNIRDWCISRQLSWGHRIPVWYCVKGQASGVMRNASNLSTQDAQRKTQDCPPIVSQKPPKKCPKCSNTNLVQDPDVLDTWFSSWLWPFAVLGWPKKTADLKYFYPTTVLNSGKDIIFFWVARMIMAGLEFTGEVPFRHVYIHGIARDHLGRKLSKSLGNSPDPIDLIGKFSADALRFGIMANIPLGGDIALSDEVYISGRNFCNKLWNASRLVLMNLPDSKEPKAKSKKSFLSSKLPPEAGLKYLSRVASGDKALCFEDRWILSRLHSTIQHYTKLLETYEFSQAAHVLYQFFWHDLCDWYLEIIKPRLYQDTKDKDIPEILSAIFSNLLRMLHPFIPHITEELWQKFKVASSAGAWFDAESIMIAPWPQADTRLIEPATEATLELLSDIIIGVRDIRNKIHIDKKQPVSMVVSTSSRKSAELIKEHLDFITAMEHIAEITVKPHLSKPSHSATAPIKDGEVFVPLEGLINPEVEKKRLEGRLKKVAEQLVKVKGSLNNHNFRAKAPEAIRERNQQRLEELTEQYTRLQNNLKDLEEW